MNSYGDFGRRYTAYVSLSVASTARLMCSGRRAYFDVNHTPEYRRTLDVERICIEAVQVKYPPHAARRRRRRPLVRELSVSRERRRLSWESTVVVMDDVEGLQGLSMALGKEGDRDAAFAAVDAMIEASFVAFANGDVEAAAKAWDETKMREIIRSAPEKLVHAQVILGRVERVVKLRAERR